MLVLGGYPDATYGHLMIRGGFGQVCLGDTAVALVGASGTNTLSIQNGTAPSAVVTDCAQIFVNDYTGGDARLYIMSEANLNKTIIGQGGVECLDVINDANALNALVFKKNRGGTGGAGQIGDEMGVVSFQSYNSAGTPQLVEYANLTGKIADETENEECGLITYSAVISGGGYEGNLPMVYTKTDAGDLTDAFEGMICINTADNTLKMYAEGAWRQLASW